MTYQRLLKLDLPPGQSAFLWGARQTGKSTFLKAIFSDSYYIDLLKSEVFFEYHRHPHLLRERILALPKATLTKPIIIDEVQKVPALLDEIHWLIENTEAYFILCGSSARKLKAGAANLLGGRAWRFEFFPLTSREISNFDLLRALKNGLLPRHYQQDNPRRSLRAYLIDYLKEEIQAEGLVRNLPAFSQFLESLGFSQGELTNYNNIAADCGIDAKTVKAYYQILIDTLLGYYVLPFRKKITRDIITSTPKFYLFDVGLAQYMAQEPIQALQGHAAGKAFEHFILMEILAYRGLHELDFTVNYWRTKTGHEVDFVLNQGKIAIEVKLSSHVKLSDIKGLLAFTQEHHPKHALVVSHDPEPRLLNHEDHAIYILPWQVFLDKLWAGEFVS